MLFDIFFKDIKEYTLSGLSSDIPENKNPDVFNIVPTLNPEYRTLIKISLIPDGKQTLTAVNSEQLATLHYIVSFQILHCVITFDEK